MPKERKQALQDYLLKQPSDIQEMVNREEQEYPVGAGRWEKGVNHHPRSIALMTALEGIDYFSYDDYFQWKTGGDGDNGEVLMYEMDVYFEHLDRKDNPKETLETIKAEEELLRAEVADLKDSRSRLWTYLDRERELNRDHYEVLKDLCSFRIMNLDDALAMQQQVASELERLKKIKLSTNLTAN